MRTWPAPAGPVPDTPGAARPRTAAAVRLAALLAGALGAVAVLHTLGRYPWLGVGWDDLPGWLATVPAEDAVAAVLRLVALVAAYWLAATTSVYTMARIARLPAAARAVGWATLPAARRLADRAVTVVLAGSLAAPAGPALAVATDGGVGALPPAVTGPATLPGDGGPTAASGPPPPAFTAVQGLAAGPGGGGVADPAGDAGARLHVVVPGDNLWAIAAADAGERATPAEVHARWRALVEANRARLRSGDPDLVYPGERIVMPPR